MPDDRPRAVNAPSDDRQTNGNGALPPSDLDLISALRSSTPAQRLALARQGSVSPLLAEALVETGEAETVAALLANRAAELSERVLLKCLDRLSDDDRVQQAMIGRDRLPPAVAQRLAAVTRGWLRAELTSRHALLPLPEGAPGELGTGRPTWWPRHVGAMFR